MRELTDGRYWTQRPSSACHSAVRTRGSVGDRGQDLHSQARTYSMLQSSPTPCLLLCFRSTRGSGRGALVEPALTWSWSFGWTLYSETRVKRAAPRNSVDRSALTDGDEAVDM